MTFNEMKELIKKAIEENEEYKYLGLRFENKQREIGEICENSRHNADRDDDRDFPEYNSNEYQNLEQFNGTSAWDLSKGAKRYVEPNDCISATMEDKIDGWFLGKHCYIIAGEKVDNHPDRDYDEIIIENARVVAKIF